MKDSLLSLMLTPTTTVNPAAADVDATANLTKIQDTEKLMENIESVISGSLPCLAQRQPTSRLSTYSINSWILMTFTK